MDDVADEPRDDAVARLRELDVRRILQHLRHARDRPLNHLRGHIVIIEQRLGDERLPLQRLERHPAARDLQRLCGLHRAGGKDVDLLLEFIPIVQTNRRRLRGGQRLFDGRAEPTHVKGIVRVHSDHRHAEVLGEMVEFNVDVALAGDIHHRDDDDHRHLQLRHEQGQVEIAFERGRVKHVHIEIRLM